MSASRVAALCVLAIAVAGCGGGGDSPSDSGSAARSGEALFEERVVGPNPGCITCHSLDPGTTLVGPSLAGVGSRAADRVPGLSEEEYLRQSILEPSAYVVDGFVDGLMPGDWGDVLTAAEVDGLVAYLVALR